jgi:hypothetical protein
MRRSRRPLVMIATALLVLQTLFGGLARGPAAAPAFDPLEAGVICHGTEGADSTGSTSPDTGSHWQACCAFCLAAVCTLLPVAPPVLERLGPLADPGLPADAGAVVPLPPRAVRAGSSQAPPSLA